MTAVHLLIPTEYLQICTKCVVESMATIFTLIHRGLAVISATQTMSMLHIWVDLSTYIVLQIYASKIYGNIR
jgi:hypothetical protein